MHRGYTATGHPRSGESRAIQLKAVKEGQEHDEKSSIRQFLVASNSGRILHPPINDRIWGT